jgi:hypothetical protein
MDAHSAAAHHGSGEPVEHGAALYFKVGFVLFVLTALEVLLYEICFGDLRESMVGLSGAMAPHFVFLLLALSAVKFWFVAMFYMHLRDDLSFLSYVFSAAMGLAAVVITALMALFLYNRSLWWANGPWK